MNVITQKVNLRMKAAGFTIMTLESKAGVNPHAV